MAVSKMIDSVVRYIIEAMTRIFGPNDDAYPTIGVQPFAGDPYKPARNQNW